MCLLSKGSPNCPMWYPWSDVKITNVLSRSEILLRMPCTRSSTESRVLSRFR